MCKKKKKHIADNKRKGILKTHENKKTNQTKTKLSPQGPQRSRHSVAYDIGTSRRSSTHKKCNMGDIYLVNVGRQGIRCLLVVKNGVGVAT